MRQNPREILGYFQHSLLDHIDWDMKAFQIESFDKSLDGIRLHSRKGERILNWLQEMYKENVALQCFYWIAFPARTAGRVLLQINGYNK